jgi:hypothetical protein
MNIPEERIAPDEAFIKTYAENEHILDWLVKQELIRDIKRYVSTGWVKVPLCVINFNKILNLDPFLGRCFESQDIYLKNFRSIIASEEQQQLIQEQQQLTKDQDELLQKQRQLLEDTIIMLQNCHSFIKENIRSSKLSAEATGRGLKLTESADELSSRIYKGFGIDTAKIDEFVKKHL